MVRGWACTDGEHMSMQMSNEGAHVEMLARLLESLRALGTSCHFSI